MNEEKAKNALNYFSSLSGRAKAAFFVLHLKKLLVSGYRSSFGKLIYSTRFCLWDWLGIFLIFSLTFFFTMLAGQKAMTEGNLGAWYAQDAGPVALSIYSIGKPKWVFYEQGSRIDNFLTKGCYGAREYSSLTDEEAKSLSYGENDHFFLESTGISYLMAWWWKLIGHPDWSTLYILFSILAGLTMVAAYFALRQVIGVLPSIFLGLLLSAYPQVTLEIVFSVRDGIRSFFCFVAIAVFLYQLKRGINWKGTIVCSLALFAICSLSSLFRNDFIALVPFIIIAVVFLHGKVSENAKKKVLLVSSIILGFAVASQMPKSKDESSFKHAIFVGLADVPYMDYLHFSADNYSKGIPYADFYAFALGASKAYRDRNEVNLSFTSKEYGDEIFKELMNLVQLYPYDFLRFAFSSSIQSMRAGYRYANEPMPYPYSVMERPPGYRKFQKVSRNFYSGLPSWLYFVLLVLTMLLFLGGNFHANILFCFAIMCLTGCYMFQFDIRHYFYLMIIPLLSFGFVLNRLMRIAFLLIRDRKRVRTVCLRKWKTYLLHCTVLAALVGLAIGILQTAKLIQREQVKWEMDAFGIAKTEGIKFEKSIVPSKLQPELSAVKVTLPDFCSGILEKENPEQNDFTEFLKVKFRVLGAGRKEKIRVFATFGTTDEYTVLPPYVSMIINPTRSYPIPMTFFARSESCTLYMPVYFTRGFSPLTGIELLADGKDIEIESVERIAETDHIRTQSAFLIPAQSEKMHYCGKIDWNRVLWAK